MADDKSHSPGRPFPFNSPVGEGAAPEPPTEETPSELPSRVATGKILPGEGLSPNGGAEGTFAGLLAEARHVPAPQGAPPPSRSRSRAASGMGAARGRVPERRIGPYVVLSELGQGGMAVVYKALQPSLDRQVAIKELRAEYVHDRQVAARFEREATSLATLQHTNIVHIYDYLKDPESAHIVMEYVDGIDLFELLASIEQAPEEVAAIIAAQVAEGLEYAHYRGIIHRDIKPSNILISKKGEVKIMDFGIARDPGKSELTQIGLAVGTPAYMAPEQIRGDRIDFRTDVFALGIVLYEMLSGTKPWSEDEGRSVTVKVLDESYPPLTSVRPGVSPELVRIVDRCLKKEPEERYETTYALRRDLFMFLNRAVPLDPRGRLVLFLRNRGFLKDDEVSSIVAPALLLDGTLRRRDAGIPLPPISKLIRPVGVAHAIAAIALLATTVLAAHAPFGSKLPEHPPLPHFQGTPPAGSAEGQQRRAGAGGTQAAGADSGDGRPGTDADKKLSEGGAPAHPLRGDEGFVKVLAEPWARVYVDGQFYDTTPFAEPIVLAPGSHTIGLRNPYFIPVDRVVEVSEKETKTLHVTLLPREDEHEEVKTP